MPALWTRHTFHSRLTLTLSTRWFATGFPTLILLAFNSVALAQPAPSVTKSFDFRNGALGWQSGFSDYPPADDRNGFYELLADIRSLPPELGTSGTGFYVQGDNHSDDLFMFLKRRLDTADGIVAGQTYQITFTLTFASNAPSGCAGAGGSPGEGVTLKAGASPAEPQALPGTNRNVWMNVDKSNQSQGGIAASVTGDIANGLPCVVSVPRQYVSIQRTHQHQSLVNANSRGELWLLVGTDSGYESTTALYYQRIDVSLVPVSQTPPVLLTYKDRLFNNSGLAAALDSVSLLGGPFAVVSEQNFFSPDRHTRINLFGYNLELKSGDDATAITVEAEDSQHTIHILPVEAVNEVPNFSWITQVTVKLPDELQGLGNVLVSIKSRGLPSNQLPVTIK